MLIPSQIANNIRSLEEDLFFRRDWSPAKKRNTFYLTVRPLLNWLFDRIKYNYNLEDPEIESELFLLCCKLFYGFDKTKSSIVPYLQKYIIFYAQKLDTKLKKSLLNKKTLVCNEKFTFLDEEFYWRDILFESKFVAAYLTKDEKYIINMILLMEDSELTRKSIADKLNINIKTCNKVLDNLQDRLEEICHFYQKE